jgi:hypothetical protein
MHLIELRNILRYSCFVFDGREQWFSFSNDDGVYILFTNRYRLVNGPTGIENR